MKNIKSILAIIGGLVSVLLIVNLAGNCTANRNKKAVETQSIELVKQKAIDSTKTAEFLKLVAVQDSLQTVYDMQIAEARRGAAYWEGIANKRKVRADIAESRADSLANIAGVECTEVIDAFRAANSELKGRNDALVSQITETEKEAYFWCEKSESQEAENSLLKGIVATKETTIEKQNYTIAVYEARLKRSNSWLNRHKDKIGFVLGFGTGILIPK
jgi:hypothetical protein